MIVSKKHKFVFISTPKTGTHTMYKILPEEYEGELQPGPYHQKNIPENYANYFVFTTVRNPFERMVSIWHALIERENYRPTFLPLVGSESFLEFVKWITSLAPKERPKGKGGVLLYPQSEWLKDVELDKFLKIENIDSEFPSVPFYVKPSEQKKIPKVLARKHKTWSDVQCKETRKLIVDWAKEDFVNFNYSEDY
ncbi:MAG: sulfotransferase family 2 domain-containing protein [Marinomonas sp.]